MDSQYINQFSQLILNSRIHISTVHCWSLGFHPCRYSGGDFWTLFLCRWGYLPNAPRNSEQENAGISCWCWTSRKTEKRTGIGRDECCRPTGRRGWRRVKKTVYVLCFDGKKQIFSATRTWLAKMTKCLSKKPKLLTKQIETLLATLDVYPLETENKKTEWKFRQNIIKRNKKKINQKNETN